MPRLRLTKAAIDALPIAAKDTVYWDAGLPGFGAKVTPQGRKVFIVLYRTAGAGSRLRKSCSREVFNRRTIAPRWVKADQVERVLANIDADRGDGGWR
jgi:hypothetical protein